MLFRVNFLIGNPKEKKDEDSLYISAFDKDDAVVRAQQFAEKVFPKMEVEMQSIAELPLGSIVTCLQSMEFVPKGQEVPTPTLFTKPSIVLS
jgi:hypothetical protein